MADVNIKKDVLLKNYSTFKIGGKAKYFTKVSSVDQLKSVISWAKSGNIPFFILGGGSNVLFSDKGYKGLVIKMVNSEVKFLKNNVKVGAGVNLLKLVLITKEKSLSGLEWAAGIPGTVGGAVFGNAGAFGTEIKNNVKEVLVFDIKTMKEKIFKNKDCKFSYRDSIFKKTKRYIIVSAKLSLKKGKKEKISKEIKNNILYRAKHHPLNFPSAGSVFKNVKIDKKTKNIFEKFPQAEKFKEKREIPAAYLVFIEGLAGKKIGGAQISRKHTNFIVNLKNARAKDVIALINFTKKKIKKAFKINLEEEIIFVK